MIEPYPQTSSRKLHWMTLGEAAQLLGVHPSTVRRWADKGDLRCMRTPGGHRRFLDRDLHAFLDARADDLVVAPSESLASALIHRTRHEMKNANLADKPWRAAFDESERAARRESGRRLLGLAIRYASRSTGLETVLEEGKGIGREYGRDAAMRGLSLADTAQALLFFREMLVRATRPISKRPQGAEDVHIRRSLQGFLDVVFCAAMDAYEQSLRDLIATGSST